MKALSLCSRIFLIVINIVALILGLGLLAAGIIIKVGVSAFVVGQIKSLTGGDITGLADIVSKLGDVGVPFIIIGVIITALTFFGCVGACLENKCMLLTYVILLLILIVLEIIAASLLFGGFAIGKFREDLGTAIEKEYVGPANTKYTDSFSAIVDATMAQLKCCGMYNYSDFDQASKWNKDYKESDTSTIQLKLPLACCKDKTNLECGKNPTDANSYWNTGCWTLLESEYYKYRTWGIVAFVVVCVLEVVLVLLALYVVWTSLPDQPPQHKWNTTQDSNARSMYIPPGTEGNYEGRGGGGRPMDNRGGQPMEGRYNPTESEHGSAYSRSMYTPDWYSQERKPFSGSPMYSSANSSFNNNFLYKPRY